MTNHDSEDGALPGLPSPPPLGATALPPGTYDGTVVLVTGGGTGLGKAVAAEFARLGADLVIASRKEDRLGAARDELAALGGRVTAAVCDIRDAERVAEVFDAAQEAYGLPGVLVNNAAANFPVPAEDMSPNAWRSVVDITLTGTFLMTREFGRRHLAAGTPGSVIDIGASYAWTGGPGFAHSAAAKAGVKSLVETLAVEWGPYGIQVNGLVPGLMPHDDMTADIRANLDPAPDDDARQPALRVGLPRELGWAATFLASPYARFITGHTLVVDGANWQRRGLVSPPVVTVREQMGRAAFDGRAASDRRPGPDRHSPSDRRPTSPRTPPSGPPPSPRTPPGSPPR
ncbi:SDR family oxidoreductase [Streptomyces sp. KL118A]|uniref:SDR family oxidoreductase n=1 Tax=Streptomyces sp. KL118A TaxID=3045153 RepID=UPI00278C3847|nr:SDR family oxidoreductase [Streptomyces sp. KL118A]